MERPVSLPFGRREVLLRRGGRSRGAPGDWAHLLLLGRAGQLPFAVGDRTFRHGPSPGVPRTQRAAFATSHSPEAIRRFSIENTLLLHRRSHLEPTQVRPTSELHVEGDLVDALVRDDVEPCSANKRRPHVVVLAEDQANIDIVNGFTRHWSCNSRAVDVLAPAGGWSHLRDKFAKDHVANMRKYRDRHMVLIVDCDEKDDRFVSVRRVIPEDLADRVFVVGAWSTPERLTAAIGCTREELGLQLATECCDSTCKTWDHDLLRHNADEVAKMTSRLKPLLFRD